LNHLYSLGPVIYSVREFSVEHTFYINELGLTNAAQFPCYVDDSISGYPALLHDLENLLLPFFVGPEDDFIAIAKRYMKAQQQQHEDGTRDLTYHSTGEQRLKARLVNSSVKAALRTSSISKRKFYFLSVSPIPNGRYFAST
jgi:hypothetical protein